MAVITPTLSVTGIFRYDEPHGSSEAALSAAIEGVLRFGPESVTLTPGELGVTATPPGGTASAMLFQSPRLVRVRLNGGTTDVVVSRMLLLVGTVTQVELFNDQLTPARQIEVMIRWAVGGTVI